MSAWHIDHGCTLYPTTYMSVPSSAASLPQEGDGLTNGLDVAPAVAMATMDFAATTAMAGAAFGVQGATLVCVASGATSTQFNAAAGMTLATNLAAAINAATVAPTTANGNISPYLRAFVWASASGTVLTVYTRIASSLLNTASNASAVLTCGALANWTSAPANASFVGGVSGPWSMFFNAAAMTAAVSAAVSSAGTYGGVVATVMGLPASGDVAHVRTGRASANIRVLGIGPTSMALVTRVIGTPDQPFEIRFDNGVIWPGVANNGIFEVAMDSAGGGPSITLGGYTWWHGQMQSGVLATSSSQMNSRLSATFYNTAGWLGTFNIPSTMGVRHSIVEGLEVSDTGGGTATFGGWVIATGIPGSGGPYTDSLRPPRLVNSRINVSRSGQASFSTNVIYGLTIDLVDVHMAYGGAVTYTAALTGAGSVASPINIRMIRPKFSGGAGGHHTLMSLLPGMQVPCSLVIEDPVDMGQFLPGDSAASICGRVLGASGTTGGQDLSLLQAIGNSETQYLLDTPRKLIEWRPAGFPTTSKSTLADGTPYVMRFSTPHTGLTTGIVTPMSPQRGMLQIVENTLGAGNRTLTQHILIDSMYGGSAYTPTDAVWWIEGTYVATDGSTKVFSTRGTGMALTADTQTWSALAFAPFAGASRNYSRWKFTVALTAVKASSVVKCSLMCGTQPLTMSEWCFIDPQFELS